MEDDSKQTIIRDMQRLLKEAGASVRREASLLVIAGGAAGLLHKLPDRGEVIIGRGIEAAIRIDDEGVSRKHACISLTPDRQAILTDLGSTNGTYVNAVRITEQALRDGDKLQIGPQTILKFQYPDAVEEEFQRKLFDSAVKDGLTGVYNKKYFLDRLEADFSYARRHRTPLTLLLFDIDRFKSINDGHGHPAGDYVLRQLAALLKPAVRGEDVFARFGGEEFVVLMRDVDDETALHLAERLRRLVEQAVFEFEGKRIPVTTSIGIGTMSAGSAMQSPADLISLADQYLYKAKRGGRNRVAGKLTKE